MSLGLLHVDSNGGKRFGFYYTLARTNRSQIASNRLLSPFLDIQLPAGLGMTFDEEMVGWYWQAEFTGQPGSQGDLAIAERLQGDRKPEGADACTLRLRLSVRDMNEFIDGAAHEAQASGTITFEHFEGAPATFSVDERRSRFNYLTINDATGEAEMRYHLQFANLQGRQFVFEGRKYMQKDAPLGPRGLREVLEDYTTLFCHVYELRPESPVELGTAYLKFKTFEDIAAFRNLADFLRSFRVTGTSDPLLQLQAQMRFLAFTSRFVLREYDPLAPEPMRLDTTVRAEVLRGADQPDFFSTRSSAELQSFMRNSRTLPIESLINTGRTSVDFESRRIFRDAFWKGSFAADTPLGWEERVRNSMFATRLKDAAVYTGGSFWKRFDAVRDGVASGHVVNYELDFLPGKPEVRLLKYPDANRSYFQQGDDILLLTYTNEPYRIVYDTIKVIDENSAVGVMHLGQFPNGVEFATFVLERHNYPFEKMSVQDHQLIFSDPRTSVPLSEELAGAWAGHLIFLSNPNVSLLNQVNPVLLKMTFEPHERGVQARYRFGVLASNSDVEFSDDFVKLTPLAGFHDEIRFIGSDMLIGRSVTPELSPILLRGLQDYVEPRGNRFACYYVLTRE